MVRTQIQLTEKQMRQLKNLASQRGVSVAEIIRQSVDRFLRTPEIISDEERIERALSIVGKYHSGKHDISTRHDDYLDECYGS